MNDEQIIEYLRARGRVTPPAHAVSDVMRAISAEGHGDRRRAPRAILAAAALLVVAVATGIGLGLGGRGMTPGGVPDCADGSGLLRYALERLESTTGYRWTEEEQTWALDPSVPLDADNPEFAWSGWTADGAYRAPDLMEVDVTDADEPDRAVGPLGFPRVVHIGGRAYGGPATIDPGDGSVEYDWQQLPDWVDIGANRLREALGHGDSLASFERLPAWEGWEVPGQGGCVVTVRAAGATSSPMTTEPTQETLVFALRIDAAGSIVAGAVERRHEGGTDEERHGDMRWRFSVRYEVPDASEFAQPEGSIYTYPPESSGRP